MAYRIHRISARHRRPRRVPPHAPRRQGPRHRVRRHGQADADRARPQRALPRAAQRSVPRLDPHDEARRRRHQGAAARRADAPVPQRDPARRLPARRREPQDPHEGPAALRQRRDLAGREAQRRDREPRDDRSRRLCLPKDLPGVHRGRPLGARRRPLDPRVGAQAAGGRDGRVTHKTRSGGRDRGGAACAGRGRRGSRGERPKARRLRRPTAAAAAPAARRRTRRRTTRRTTRRSKPFAARRRTKARGAAAGLFRFTHPTMANPIRLVAGLGNPGREYARTRHNAGFWFVDALARKLGVSLAMESKFAGEVAKAGDVRFVKPSTFMNLSGRSGGRARALLFASRRTRSSSCTTSSTFAPARRR